MSLVESHDLLLLDKIGRYTKEPIKRRVVDSLRPTSHMPNIDMLKKAQKSKKHHDKKSEQKQKEKPKEKVRLRDKKNIGKRRKPKTQES